MTNETSLANDVAIWERVLHFDGELSATAARALLKVRFSPQDLDQMRELSAKARAGSLNSSEQQAIDTYEPLGCLLDILHSKARRALGNRKTTS